MELWRLQLFTINLDPGAKALPVVSHDLELNRDGLQLSWRRVANFYCEFFSQVAPYILWQSTDGKN